MFSSLLKMAASLGRGSRLLPFGFQVFDWKIEETDEFFPSLCLIGHGGRSLSTPQVGHSGRGSLLTPATSC